MTLLLSLLKSYWPQLVAVFGAAAIGAFGAWHLQGLRIDAFEIEFGKYRNEVEQNALTAKRAAVEKEKFWQGEIENARINAQAREARLKKDVAVATAAAGGLRDDLRTLHSRLAISSSTASLDAAVAIGDLLVKCSDDYRAMAEIADRHAADVQTLTSAWPK